MEIFDDQFRKTIFLQFCFARIEFFFIGDQIRMIKPR